MKNEYLDWLLTDARDRAERATRDVNWFTAGLLIGGLLVYFA